MAPTLTFRLLPPLGLGDRLPLPVDAGTPHKPTLPVSGQIRALSSAESTDRATPRKVVHSTVYVTLRCKGRAAPRKVVHSTVYVTLRCKGRAAPRKVVHSTVYVTLRCKGRAAPRKVVHSTVYVTLRCKGRAAPRKVVHSTVYVTLSCKGRAAPRKVVHSTVYVTLRCKGRATPRKVVHSMVYVTLRCKDRATPRKVVHSTVYKGFGPSREAWLFLYKKESLFSSEVLTRGLQGAAEQDTQGTATRFSSGLEKVKTTALAGAAQLIGACPVNQKVVGAISGQGTHLGCRFYPRSGCVQLIDVSLSHRCFSLPSSLSKNQ
ncbi:uncharacterized protein WM277_004349 [Molossus nigricans]